MTSGWIGSSWARPGRRAHSEACHGINSEATLALSLRDGSEMGCVIAVIWDGSVRRGRGKPRNKFRGYPCLVPAGRPGNGMCHSRDLGMDRFVMGWAAPRNKFRGYPCLVPAGRPGNGKRDRCWLDQPHRCGTTWNRVAGQPRRGKANVASGFSPWRSLVLAGRPNVPAGDPFPAGRRSASIHHFTHDSKSPDAHVARGPGLARQAFFFDLMLQEKRVTRMLPR